MYVCLDEVINQFRGYDKDFIISILLGYIFGEYLPDDPYEDLSRTPDSIWRDLIKIHMVYLANGK